MIQILLQDNDQFKFIAFFNNKIATDTKDTKNTKNTKDTTSADTKDTSNKKRP